MTSISERPLVAAGSAPQGAEGQPRGATGRRAAHADAQLPEFGKKISALDGVRGISILVLLLFHYEVPGFQVASGVGKVVWWGINVSWMGLEGFFVLSGLLITGILLETKGRPSYFRNFYMRRVLRILPLYYGCLFVLFVILPLVGAEPATPFSRQVWYWAHSTNFLFVFRGVQHGDRYSMHFWSLAMQEQYYLIWPLVVYLLDRRALMAVCAAAVAASLVLRTLLVSHGISYNSLTMLTPTHLDGLAMGSFMAAAVRGPGGLPDLLRRVRPVALTALVALVAMFAWRATPVDRDAVTMTLGHSMIIVLFGCAAILAVAVRTSSWAGAVLHQSWLRTCGVRSYGVYVIHFPVMVFLQEHHLGLGTLTARFGSVAWAQVAWLAMNFGGTVGLTMASWYLYERHFMKLKRRYSYRSSRPAPIPDPGLPDGATVVLAG